MSMATATTMAEDPRSPTGKPAGGPRLREWYARFGALAGYLLAAAAVYVGWVGSPERNITAKTGLGYALGILGGTLMLVLLIYSMRKRLPFMRHFGATRHWFRGHMILGILGPVLILFHCNFKLGDLNSRVALYCTLLVAGSGIVGRYLYAGFHQGLYGRQTTLQELVRQLQITTPGGRASSVTAEVRAALEAIDRQVLAPPESVVQTVLRPLAIEWQTRTLTWRLRRLVHRRLVAQAMVSSAIDQHAERLEDSVRRYLDDHLRLVRQVAQFSAFERLFALWHVVHVPFFIMLVISAIVHVVAVHLY
jgi:hypothetical protein